MQVAFILNL